MSPERSGSCAGSTPSRAAWSQAIACVLLAQVVRIACRPKEQVDMIGQTVGGALLGGQPRLQVERGPVVPHDSPDGEHRFGALGGDDGRPEGFGRTIRG